MAYLGFTLCINYQNSIHNIYKVCISYNFMIESEENFENFVFEEALKNAISYKGKANPKALLGKIIPKFPFIKDDMSHYMNLIENICIQINNLSLSLQIEKLKELNPNFFEKKLDIPKEKKDGLPNMEVLEGEKVVVRFEPAPSGHLHLGHLFALVSNYEFKKKYGGKFILRIADTNPDNIDISNYEKVIEDVKWMCDGDVDEIVYQSDRLDIYYKYLRTLVELGEAYICTCDSEVFKSYTDASSACPHRENSIEKNIEMYDMMFNGKFKEGEAVIRAKGDLENKNPALRSFPLARINLNLHARAKNKYRVWPNMNLAVAIDDSLMGISHVIRGKDHEINMLRQMEIQKSLNLRSPKYFHFGRMKFEDINLSKTELTKLIEEKVYESWEDPRVPSLISHRKRAYKAEAFRKFILSLGISKRDSKINSIEYYKGLDFFNKQILEKEADRLFFVYNPRKISIINLDDISENEIKIPKHPEDKSRGFRHIKLENNYFIDFLDFEKFEEGDIIRLMHFANFRVVEKYDNELKLLFLSKDYDKNLNLKGNIHFVSKDAKKIILIMQDNSHLKGLVDNCDNLVKDKSFQFERFGFVKFDSIDENKNKIFYFTHR